MLARIREFFQQCLDTESPGEQGREGCIRLASAALLIEVSRADHADDPREQAAIAAALKQCFGLDDATLEELLELAAEEAREATSLYQFTRLINDRYSEADKYQLVRMMWQVAHADGSIDRYEDHLIRKIADLIYLPHSLFIRAKLEVTAGTS